MFKKKLKNNIHLWFIVAILALTPVGCTEEEVVGEGTYDVSIYGESYVEERIPADAMIDGWEVTFDRFLIAVDAITLTSADNQVALDPAGQIFDLSATSDGGHPVDTMAVPEGKYTGLSYRVGPVSAVRGGNASDEDVSMMMESGLSIYVEGSAERDGTTHTFTWSFDTDTTYSACQTSATITDGGQGSSQLTIHADHLFYDDLFDEEPNVAFDLIASADADGDLEITREELEAVDITAESRYQVGSADITDLWSFIDAQTRTLGHIDGEGHCDAP